MHVVLDTGAQRRMLRASPVGKHRKRTMTHVFCGSAVL